MEIITKNAEETKALGRKFGASLKGGEVIALNGDLGAGKTTFVQGVAEGLGLKGKIISPTFILMRQQSFKEGTLYHVDLYRLEGEIENEIINLGLSDIWDKDGNIVIVEWANKAKDVFPKKTIWVEFEKIDEDKRRINFNK